MNDTRLQRFSGSLPDVAACCAFDHVWARPSRLRKKGTEALWQGLHLLSLTSHLCCLQCVVDMVCLSPVPRKVLVLPAGTQLLQATCQKVTSGI